MSDERSEQTGAWFCIDNGAADRAAEVGASAWLVYGLLCRHARDRRCWPGLGRLAKMSGMTTRNVRYAIKRLEEAGWIVVERSSGKGNVYRLPQIGPGKEISPDPGNTFPHTQERDFPRPRKPVSSDPGNQFPPNKTKEQDQRTKPKNKQERSATADQASTNGYTRAFEDWWKIYPKKVGKGAAFKAWKKATGKIDNERLIEITRRFSKSPAGNRGQYTPNPATWLNEDRFNDDQNQWHQICEDGNAKSYRHKPGLGQRSRDERELF